MLERALVPYQEEEEEEERKLPAFSDETEERPVRLSDRETEKPVLYSGQPSEAGADEVERKRSNQDEEPSIPLIRINEEEEDRNGARCEPARDLTGTAVVEDDLSSQQVASKPPSETPPTREPDLSEVAQPTEDPASALVESLAQVEGPAEASESVSARLSQNMLWPNQEGETEVEVGPTADWRNEEVEVLIEPRNEEAALSVAGSLGETSSFAQ